MASVAHLFTPHVFFHFITASPKKLNKNKSFTAIGFKEAVRVLHQCGEAAAATVNSQLLHWIVMTGGKEAYKTHIT